MTTNEDRESGQTRSPLVQLILARVLEFTRQPEAIFWSYVFPVLMVLALGLAFRNKSVTQIVVDVVGQDGTAAVQQRLEQDPERRFQIIQSDEDDARLRLRTARTDLIVMVGSSVASALENDASSAAGTGDYHYLYDPTRPESAIARLRVDDTLQRAAGRVDPVPVSDQLVQQPGSRYVDFLVPGLLGMNIMAGGLWGVGFAIVYMRIRKLLKRLVATPMRKSHFLTGIIVSRLLFLIPGVLVILLFAWLVFGVVIQGTLLDLIVFILAGAMAFSGIGLLVASRANTIEMVSGLMNLVMLPMWVFSGVFFSSDRFPSFMQPFVKALPLTPLIDGLRGTMLEGQGLTAPGQLMRLGALVAWSAITFALALRWFRWN